MPSHKQWIDSDIWYSWLRQIFELSHSLSKHSFSGRMIDCDSWLHNVGLHVIITVEKIDAIFQWRIGVLLPLKWSKTKPFSRQQNDCLIETFSFLPSEHFKVKLFCKLSLGKIAVFCIFRRVRVEAFSFLLIRDINCIWSRKEDKPQALCSLSLWSLKVGVSFK